MRGQYLVLLCLIALAGCEKPPLVRYPGDDPISSPGQAQNTPPTVNAGDDATIQWPADSVQLTGSATDDGLPAFGSLTYSWATEASGVNFDNFMAAATLARFPAPGTYTLTLTANDGALQSVDSMVVTVVSNVLNTAPVVSAGVDQTIEMPRAATLDGTATDDGIPGPLTTTWSFISGPGVATFANVAAVDTTVTFTAAGTYELQLSVNDGSVTTTDSVMVTVTSAVFPGADVDNTDPDRSWVRVPPSEVGMDPALLAEAEAYALQAGGAGLISRYGRLVYSWGDIDQRYDLKSTTASIGSIALAMALQDNRVTINDRAATHLPTVGVPPATNDVTQLQTITLLQLATHTAGFEKTGGYGQLLAAPGAEWRYSDGGLNWLADTLTTVYADDLQSIFNARVWPVLGARNSDISWRNPATGLRRDPRPNGILHREFASGLIGNVNSMARVGLLFLRRGEWAGQRLFAPEFTDLVRTPRPESAAATLVEAGEYPDANRRYGVLWWTNATGALPNVPRDAYWAWGLYDSLIVVIPSLDLVIARAGPLNAFDPAGRTFGEGDWDTNYDVLAPFLDPIVRSVTTP